MIDFLQLFIVLCISCITSIPITTSIPIRNTTDGDMGSCLKHFYQVAYDGMYNCTNSFPFFSDDITVQPTAFKTGKACFLEVAKAECTSSQYSFLSTKYDQFLESISTPPTGENVDCSIKYFKYGALKCIPAAVDFGAKSQAVDHVGTKVNDSRVLYLMEECPKLLKCMEPKCFSAEQNVQSLRDVCDTIVLKNSEFMGCQVKITKQAPDLSEYTCLDGLDFYDESLKTQVELVTLKKDCMKTIMEEVCGDKSVANFDEDVAGILKNLKMRARIRAALDN
ncbi:unnamed protein product [Caenorhabditis brenneri]